MDSSTSETSESVFFLFLFPCLFPLEHLVYMQYFPDSNSFKQRISTRNGEKKSSLKEYVRQLVLNCDLWKTFSPVRVILWLVYKVTENNCCLSLFFEFIQAQKRYPTFFDKINFLPAKYPISVAAALIWIKGT